MKAKDQFIEWLREKILQNPEEPPANTWQGISGELDLEESWEKIGEELEINTIWDKIGGRLDRYDRLVKLERFSYAFSAAAAIALLFNLFVTNPLTEGRDAVAIYENSEENITANKGATGDREEELPKPPPITEIAENGIPQGTEIREDPASPTKNTSDIPKTFNDRAQTTKTENTIAHSESYVDVEPDIPVQLNSHKEGDAILSSEYIFDNNHNVHLPDISSNGVAIFLLPIGEPSATQIKQDLPSIANLPEVKLPQAYPASYFGLGTAVKLSWLLNNKTLYAMEKSSLLKATPSYHTDWFLQYGTRLRDRLFLQTDLYLNEVVGQDYEEYRNGKYGTIRDRLYYRSLAISLSRIGRQVGSGRLPTFVRLTGGLYGGQLSRAEEVSFTRSTDTSSEYARYHLGAFVGYEYDTFLSSRFILSYGLRSRLDLLNIYTGSESVPSSFKRTRALSVDFSLSVKYAIQK